MKDGLYRVQTNYLTAGFVVKSGRVVQCAPILRKKINYWKTIATLIKEDTMPSQPIVEFSGFHRFLSNFYPSRIEYGGRVYPTVEHFYQAMKSTDEEYREMISQLETPGKAKRAGQVVKLRPDWEDIKDDVMLYALRRKFTEHEDLKAQLLRTADRPLKEGNYWHDNYWGACTCEKCADRPKHNKLGWMLMQVRGELS